MYVTNFIFQWSKFDCIYEIYLENMETESVLNMRNCYIQNLALLLKATSNELLRWCKRLLRIFNEYIEIAVKHDDDFVISCSLKVNSLLNIKIFF